MSTSEDYSAPLDLEASAQRELADDSAIAGMRTNRRGAMKTARRQGVNLLYNYSVLWALLAEIAIFSFLRPASFFSLANAESILGSQAILLVVALGLTIPLAVGEFDLSIGAMVGFSQVILATLTVQHNWSVVPAVIVAIGACVLVGVVNALLVVRLGVGAFICTLAMATLLIGIGAKITNFQPVAGIPSSLVRVTSSTFLGLELVFWYGLAGTAVLWYILAQTPLGRWLYFTGANREAARLNGLPVDLIRGGALVASAGIAGVAGVLYAGVFATADPSSAQDQFLLPAYAAAFLGATAVTPGRFNAWGTFISVYLVVTGIVGLSLVMNQVSWIAFVFNGSILLVAIAVQRVVAVRRTRPGGG